MTIPMTTAEILVKAHKDKVFTRHFTYIEASDFGKPFNTDREIKSFIFPDGSVIEFEAVLRASPF